MAKLTEQQVTHLYEEYPDLNDPYFKDRKEMSYDEEKEESTFLITLNGDSFICISNPFGKEEWWFCEQPDCPPTSI